MTVRLGFALAILLGLTAFAPAPLPRQERRGQGDEITLETFQGNRRVLSIYHSRSEGQPMPVAVSTIIVRIVNDRWTYFTNDVESPTYYVTLDHSKRPALLNFYSDQQKTHLFAVGLIRQRGGKVEVLHA